MPKRAALFGRLKTELAAQILPYAGLFELLSDDNMDISIGEKRNKLLRDASGEYVISLDDDDWIVPKYTKHLIEAANSDCDCASLRGMYNVDGVDDGIFEHSIRYQEWRTTDNYIKYERYPTPLNLIRSSIAKQFQYPDIRFGEDHAWSKQIHESGLLQKEYYVDELTYIYRFISKK